MGSNDYDVLDDSRQAIGRIFLSPASPPDRNWMRTITAREYPPTIHRMLSNARASYGGIQGAVAPVALACLGVAALR